MPTYNIDGYVSRSDLLFVEPSKIKIVEGFNPRTENFNLEPLKELIKVRGGLLKPLLVKNEKGYLELLDGERRLRSIFELCSEGFPIKSVPVLIDKTAKTPVERLIVSMVSNDGSEPLTQFDEANAIVKLKNTMPLEEIAKQLGKSVGYLYNRLKLLQAEPIVIDALQNGEITTSDVIKIVKTSKIDNVPQNQVLPIIQNKMDGRGKGNNTGKGKHQTGAHKTDANKPTIPSPVVPIPPVVTHRPTITLTPAERQNKAIRENIANLIDTLSLDTFLQMVVDYEGIETVEESFNRIKNGEVSD